MLQNLMGGSAPASGLIHTERTQIGDNLFVDVVLSRESALESEVTENPVEDGFVIADHVRRKPLSLAMECIFTPTPVSFDAKGTPSFRMNSVANEIMRIYKAGDPVTIKTPDAIYKDMVMLTSPLVRSVQNGLCYRMQMTFKHVRIVNQRKEDIPAEGTSDEAAGKAGATEDGHWHGDDDALGRRRVSCAVYGGYRPQQCRRFSDGQRNDGEHGSARHCCLSPRQR